MAFTIEKNIAVPPITHKPDALADTLMRLEPGDSVFVPFPVGSSGDNAERRLRQSILVRIHRLRKKADPNILGKEFATRRVEGGVRVWRTV